MDGSTVRISHIQSLEDGEGLQYLINEAYKILGNPLLLHNMEYELLACTDNIVTDDWIWNEIVGMGVFSDESIRFFLEECFIDIVANTKSIAILKSDKLKYERVYGRIFNSYNDTVIDLIMLACEKPIEDQDLMILEAVCDKLSHEIDTSEFFKRYGINYHNKMIYKLLEADIDDKLLYSAHLSNLYEGLKTNLYVVVADINDYNADKKKLEEYRNLFKEIQPEFKYAVYSNYIVIIVSTDAAALNIKRDLHLLSRHFDKYKVRIGISTGFDNLFDLRKYYNEAVDLLIKYKVKIR